MEKENEELKSLLQEYNQNEGLKDKMKENDFALQNEIGKMKNRNEELEKENEDLKKKLNRLELKYKELELNSDIRINAFESTFKNNNEIYSNIENNIKIQTQEGAAPYIETVEYLKTKEKRNEELEKENEDLKKKNKALELKYKELELNNDIRINAFESSLKNNDLIYTNIENNIKKLMKEQNDITNNMQNNYIKTVEEINN